ncbi:MAG: YidC/Oxa1 family membrane protein insertase [Coriobacteriia bacterium]|nr:YidC/Oxa1 family membrane protein insertase [Coriobacteriia bacterium]
MGALWAQFQGLIFQALLYLEGITNDWGMAIILLTLAIRMMLLPLTWKQTKSMVEMQRVQPHLKALQEKYKDDKEKLQEETLKFYSENKVNPFGGCLPLLLQFPVLIALYGVLGPGNPKKGQPGLMIDYLAKHGEVGTFYGIIPDISKTPAAVWASHDYITFIPYILLVILFAVSIWLPQALMPGDKQQKMIGGYMAVIMLYFGWVSPAGVLLYWDVSSLFGIAQQQLTMSVTKRDLEKFEKDVADAKAAEKAAKKAGGATDALAGKKPANTGQKKSKKKS